MRSFLAAICTFFSIQSFATTIDSVGVENNNGNQIIIHKVAPKESYYSIGRLYNVSPKDIISFNNNISLNIGTLLKVPTTRAYQSTPSVKSNSSTKEASKGDIIEHKVEAKESLFSIARKFGSTVDNIKQLNNLTNINLSIGQVLKIKQGDSVKPAITTVIEETKAPAASVQVSKTPLPLPQTQTAVSETTHVELPKPKARVGRLGVTERSEKGIAVAFEDEALDNGKMLALHRFAPVGTIIRVTNPMTDRVTFVKVVGKFTENESTKEAIIVLTKATADQLGALDKRFLVNIDYGMPNE